jgi:hypothetical protein
VEEEEVEEVRDEEELRDMGLYNSEEDKEDEDLEVNLHSQSFIFSNLCIYFDQYR